MAAIFTKLWSMSMAASWLIAAVIILRPLLKKAPKWINCLLWGLVAVRLVCPVSFESALSLVPSEEAINAGIAGSFMEPDMDSKAPLDVRPVALGTGGNPAPEDEAAAEAAGEAGADSLWRNAAAAIWIIGMIGLWGYALIRYLRLRRTVSEAVPLGRSVSGAVPFREDVWICDGIRSPFLSGIIRPRIYISSSTEESQIGYILAHERAHLKRRDHWWKLIGFLLLTVYWFHPLSWAAYILFCRDIELACDEKVIRRLGEEEKRLYSKALLSCSTQRRVVLACPPAFGEVGVKRRVMSILGYRKPAFWAVLLSVLICLIVAVCFLTTSPKTWQIKVTIPADGDGTFCYSEEEISPKGNTLTLYAGEGMEDGEIRLLPVEASQENAYDEAFYLTPGMPVKIDVEKGAWFKIGVRTQNPSGEDRDVYLSVENVEVRIASEAPEDAEEELDSGGEAAESPQRDPAAVDRDTEPEPPKETPPVSPFPIEFLFATGASSAGTTLTLNQDGSFSGKHFDHENIIGEGYPNGACYICYFSGQFEDIQQIDAHTYSMTLGEIVTEREKGEEWIEDGVLYMATEPAGLEDGKEFLLYTPGTPLDELSEDFLSWWMGRGSYQEDGESAQTLPCYGLQNVANGKGFFQWER